MPCPLGGLLSRSPPRANTSICGSLIGPTRDSPRTGWSQACGRTWVRQTAGPGRRAHRLQLWSDRRIRVNNLRPQGSASGTNESNRAVSPPRVFTLRAEWRSPPVPGVDVLAKPAAGALPLAGPDTRWANKSRSCSLVPNRPAPVVRRKPIVVIDQTNSHHFQRTSRPRSGSCGQSRISRSAPEGGAANSQISVSLNRNETC